MLVTVDNYKEVKSLLASYSSFAFDTETTGLFPFLDDCMFGFSVAIDGESFYFPVDILGRDLCMPILELVLNRPGTVYMMNAKFDMAFASNYGVEKFTPTIYDIEVLFRLYKNNTLRASLEVIAEHFGLAKDESVMNYIRKNKLYKTVEGVKQPMFEAVPLEIMAPYASKDAEITLYAGEALMSLLTKQNDLLADTTKDIFNVVDLEAEVTKALFDIECEGVLYDAQYTKKALAETSARNLGAKGAIEGRINKPFVDSGKVLKELFDDTDNRGKFVFTDKGNPSFTDDVLSNFSGELAENIRSLRETSKLISTYYKAFGRMADVSGRIHTNYRQTGAATGRLSSAGPNLQNIPRGPTVRGCFIAPVDHKWWSFDYDQIEYRVMVGYAGEYKLAEKINAGLDVHQATADMMGVPRQQAKTLNFMLLYGGGAKALAEALGVSEDQGISLKERYFEALPRVQLFMRAVTEKADRTGYVFNPFGMILHIDKGHGYKAPNHLIQSTAAYVMKTALVNIQKMIRESGCKSRMIMTVHDSAEFYLHNDEEERIVPIIKQIMETAYINPLVPLTVEPECKGERWQ